MFQLTKEAIERRESHPALARWYQSYLRSNVWRRKCVRIATRSAGVCEECDSGTGRCSVHHLTYENITQERLNQLKYLCEKCHKEAHDKKIIPFAERIYDETYMKVRTWN